MAKPTLFLVGATGYVGGEILAQILRQQTFSVTCQVRTQAQADKLQAAEPSVRVVLGTLDSHDTLVKESSNADVIIQSANCDHAEGALAILEGARQTTRATKPLVVQISGTASLIDPAIPLGTNHPRALSDRDDMEELMNLPPDRPHIAVEQQLYAKAEESELRLVLLAPGQIFGRGAGHFRQENELQYPVYDTFVKEGRAMMIGDGSCSWGWSSVRDLADAVVLVVKEGLKGDETRLSFGRRGIYLLGVGEIVLRDWVELLAKRLVAQGKLKSDKVVSLTVEEATKVNGNFIFLGMLGSSSRYRADRLVDLGWKPQELDWRPLVAEEGKWV